MAPVLAPGNRAEAVVGMQRLIEEALPRFMSSDKVGSVALIFNSGGFISSEEGVCDKRCLISFPSRPYSSSKFPSFYSPRLNFVLCYQFLTLQVEVQERACIVNSLFSSVVAIAKGWERGGGYTFRWCRSDWPSFVYLLSQPLRVFQVLRQLS